MSTRYTTRCDWCGREFDEIGAERPEGWRYVNIGRKNEGHAYDACGECIAKLLPPAAPPEER